jgi:hypothetical protein
MNQIQLQPEHQETVRRLRAVTRRIEAFLGSQMQRLAVAMKQVRDMQAEYESARRLTADIQAQRNTWQRDRDVEVKRLEQANEALVRSWNELEKQQRELEIALLQARATDSRSDTKPVASATPATRVPMSRELHQARKAATAEMDLFVMKQLQAQVKKHQKRKR